MKRLHKNKMTNLNDLEQKMDQNFNNTNKIFDKIQDEMKDDFHKILKKEINNSSSTILKEIDIWKRDTLSQQFDGIYKYIDDINTQQKDDMQSNIKAH